MHKKFLAALKSSPSPGSSSRSSSSVSSMQRMPSWQMSDLDSDEESVSRTNQPPPDVPKGFFAAYAGSKRFIVSTKHLTHPIFRALLQKAADEYGFRHSGALQIPCEAVLFEHFLWLLDTKDPVCAKLEQIHDLVEFYNRD
ncbi:auxin-induced protein 6B [Selaginella moellendorffii]|nr:auxin-induced protein 6B [Selaginella moellendorffii]|eukprot:XP_024529841.1 auxin-induced protein 6B [Selaginella moellendorffii]